MKTVTERRNHTGWAMLALTVGVYALLILAH